MRRADVIRNELILQDELSSIKKGVRSLGDPIPRLAGQLKAQKLLDDSQRAALEARAWARVDEAYAFARSAEYPAPADALADLFV